LAGKEKMLFFRGSSTATPSEPAHQFRGAPVKTLTYSLSLIAKVQIPLYTENRSERTRSRSEKPIFPATGIILPRPPNRELP